MARPIQPGIRTPGDPGPDEALLREAWAHWATGVSILAVRDGDDVDALTVSAFVPLSLRPPLVLVSLGNDASVLTTLLEVGRFTVNVLPAGAERQAGLAASRSPLGELPFSAGDPVLEGALVSLVCRHTEDHAGGDHRIVIGAVEAVRLGPEAGPLLYFRREYRALDGG